MRALKTKRSGDALLTSTRKQHNARLEVAHPIAPWGVIIAFAALIASLGFMLVITLAGGLNLG